MQLLLSLFIYKTTLNGMSKHLEYACICFLCGSCGLEPSFLNPELDIVLVMTIKAGWTGRSFKQQRLEEVRKLKELKQKKGYQFKIAVDGGINKKTIKDCLKAGAELLFMHIAIWQAKDPEKRLKELKSMAKT